MTKKRSEYVFWRGRAVRACELPFWRRFLRWALWYPRMIARRLRRRRLARWATAELERIEEEL